MKITKTISNILNTFLLYEHTVSLLHPWLYQNSEISGSSPGLGAFACVQVESQSFSQSPADLNFHCARL